VATDAKGVDELWEAVLSHRAFLETDGRLDRRREDRLREELRAIVLERLRARVDDVCAGERFDKLVGQVAARELDPYAAADELLSGS
jgi:LAO/AO transport system kinase